MSRGSLETTDNPRAFWTFWTTLPGILTGLAAIVGAVVAVASFLRAEEKGTSGRTPQTEHVAIGSPFSGKRVQSSFTVSGVAQGVPGDRTIWLILNAESDYYPAGRLTPHPDGRWSESMDLGSGDSGEVFTVVVAEADSAADEQFSRWKTKADTSGNYVPLSKGTDLPAIKVVDSVIVVRQ